MHERGGQTLGELRGGADDPAGRLQAPAQLSRPGWCPPCAAAGRSSTISTRCSIQEIHDRWIGCSSGAGCRRSPTRVPR
ncbi:hypothetical protein HBB16_20070 [Pseudonocardia sp. MCCB 268]|nr:hypothetical protein [Pseudonocardia cytotoxica]